MSTESLKPVYLIVGTDGPKVERALQRLRARFDPASVEYVEPTSGSQAAARGVEAVAALNALGLFGGGERLVVVERVGSWRKDDVDALSEYLASPTPGAVLALVDHELPKSSHLPALCGQHGDLLRYDAPVRKDLPVWLRAQFERLGGHASADAARRLAELVGEDVFALTNEVDKLVAWAAGDEIGPRDVEALVAPSQETSSFALVDAWGSRDVRGALEACETMLMHDEPFRLSARLADYVRRVRGVQSLLEQELTVKEIAARLGVKEFPARKHAGQAANFTPHELSRAVIRLASLDHAIKGGSRLSAQLELERAIVEVT